MSAILTPGCRVKIRNPKNKTAEKATILELHAPDMDILKVSACEPGSNHGDRIELDVPKKEKALCIFQAEVLEGGAGKGSILHLLGKPKILQRRKSRRKPVHHRAEYILLMVKRPKEDFHPSLLLNISRDGALLATREPLNLCTALFLIFEVNLHVLFGGKVLPTGIGGKVVREHSSHSSLKVDVPGGDAGAGEWEHSYGIAFDKPFVALKR